METQKPPTIENPRPSKLAVIAFIPGSIVGMLIGSTLDNGVRTFEPLVTGESATAGYYDDPFAIVETEGQTSFNELESEKARGNVLSLAEQLLQASQKDDEGAPAPAPTWATNKNGDARRRNLAELANISEKSSSLFEILTQRVAKIQSASQEGSALSRPDGSDDELDEHQDDQRRIDDQSAPESLAKTRVQLAAERHANELEGGTSPLAAVKVLRPDSSGGSLEELLSHLAKSLKNEDYDDRSQAHRLYAAAEGLVHGIYSTRERAQKSLVDMGLKSEPFLVAALKGTKPAVAECALECLRRIGSEMTLESIADMLASDDEGLRLVALRTAQRLEKDEARPFLIAGAKDPSPRVRHRVISYLSWREDSWADTLLHQLSEDTNVTVRMTALETLAEDKSREGTQKSQTKRDHAT